MYVGIRKSSINSGEVLLKYISPLAPVHDPDSLNASIHFFGPKHSNKFIAKHLKHLQLGLAAWASSNDCTVPEFRVWSELPFAVGLNAGASVSACLGLLMFACEKKLTAKQLAELDEAIRGTATGNLETETAFERIFQLARWCDSLLASRQRSGAQVFAALKRPNPMEDVVFYLPEAPELQDCQSIVSPSKEFGRRITRMANRGYLGKRFSAPDWFRDVIRISIVYCGELSDPHAVLTDIDRWHRQPTERLRKFLKSNFGEIVTNNSSFAQPMRSLVEKSFEIWDQEAWPLQLYTAALGGLSWRIIDVMHEDSIQTRLFLDLLVDYNKLLKAFGVLRGELRRFKRDFRGRVLDPDLGNRVWTKLIGPGNGGNLLVFGESHDILAMNKFLLTELQRDPNYPYRLHCTSAENALIAPEECSSICTSEVILSPKRVHLVKSPETPAICHLQRQEDGSVKVFVRSGVARFDATFEPGLDSDFVVLLVGDPENRRPAISAFEIVALQVSYHKSRSEVRAKQLQGLNGQQRSMVKNAAANFIDNFRGRIRKLQIPGFTIRSLVESCDIQNPRAAGLTVGWRLRDDVSYEGFDDRALRDSDSREFDEGYDESLNKQRRTKKSEE